MPSPTPLISIGMPTFNRANYLTETIESILAQDFTDFELVILNNGSTDNTADIIARMASRDTRVRPLENAVNQQIVPVHNELPAKCRGRFFIFAGDDDPWKPHRLSTLLKLMENGQYSVVYSDWEEINAQGEPFRSSLTRPMPATSEALRDLFVFSRFSDVRMVLGLVQRSLLLDRPFFRATEPSMGWFSDGYFVFHLLSTGTVAFSPEKTYFKRWENPKGYQADYREENTFEKINHQLLWAGSEIFTLLRQSRLNWLRKWVMKAGFAYFFYERLFLHLRSYGWQFSGHPDHLRRFSRNLLSYARENHLQRGTGVIRLAAIALPWLKKISAFLKKGR